MTQYIYQSNLSKKSKILLSVLFLTILALFPVYSFSQIENPNNIEFVEVNLLNLQKELFALSSANLQSSTIIDLPMPGNCTHPFEVKYSSIVDTKFAKHYPSIKSYAISSIEKEIIYGRLTLSHLGIHATILSPDGTIGIFPIQNSNNNTSHKITIGSLHKGDWNCGLVEDPKSAMWQAHYARQKQKQLQKSFGYSSGDETITYDLAILATGEFYEDNLDSTNGSANDDEDVTAIIVSVIDGVQVFFDRDVAVRFNLLDIPILWSSAASDPFTPDNDGGSSRTTQARTQINANYNINDYDLGHVLHHHETGDNWSTGGVAGLGVVCNDNISSGGPSKARGWSGSFDNQTTSFIGLTAHEIGHQFDATHTFNGTGESCTDNISSTSSYEIASGVTIMAYVGICSAAQNIPITGTAHDYFHTHSLTQIINYINISGTCGTSVSNGNTPPTVDANPCSGTYTIPISTPFELNGTGSDSNGDAITYTWEQYDEDGTGTPTQGDIGADAADNTDTNPTPLFRNYPPSTSSSRTIPAIDKIIANDYTSDFEPLPTVSRTLNFRLTARDNNANGGGVACSPLSISVDAGGGPFAVTAPNDGTESWAAGSSYTVTWNEGDTDIAPISCGVVDIRLSIDGGLTYPYTLVSGTSNDGTQIVPIPAGVPDVTTARIRVECASNDCVRFFDISDNDFEITSDCSAASSYICPTDNLMADQGDLSLNLDISSVYGETTTSETRNIDGSDPIVSRGIADSQGSTTCTVVGTRAYESFEFIVFEAGDYVFTQSSPGFLAVSIFEADGFIDTNPCASTFVGSSGYSTGGGGASNSWPFTVTLEACTEYIVMMYASSSAYGDNTMSILSGASDVIRSDVAPGANYDYTYVAINQSDDLVDAVSSTADFTSLGAGTYNVYGVSYKASGGGSPADVDSSTFIDESLSDILSSGDCVLFSNNSKQVTVNAVATCNELFFSEYIEGSSNNKCLEIYNPTANTIDLSAGNYEINTYSNGSTTVNLNVDLVGSIASGDVFVVCHPSASFTPSVSPDQTANLIHTGDDAIELLKDGTAIDVIGQIGFDPGSEWGSGVTSTGENTLRRKSTIQTGDPDGSDAFDPSIEWDGYAQNNADNLGSHTSDCVDCTPYTITITGDLEYCSNDGSTTLDAGVGYTTYAWSNNESSQQITATAGTYFVTVTNASGCTGTGSTEVSENTSPNPSITGDLAYCSSEANVTLDAGAGFTTYAWSNNESSQQISATAGIYTVTVTDDNGCTGTDSVEVTENANPTPAITGNLTYCTGGNTTIDAGAGFTTYAWSNNESTQQITVTAGIYTVTVTDGNGCTGTDSVEVIENSNLTPTITGDLDYCANDGSTTLDAGAGYTTYAWSNNESNQQITATAGTYFVTVTDASGCTGTDSVEVTENPHPTPDITGDLEYCSNEANVTLDAGAGFTTYAWSNNESSQQITATAGIYTVTVTDGNGCTGTDSVEVSENQSPNPTITGDLEICPDESTVLDAGAFAYAVEYLWSNNGEITQTISVSTTGSYFVTVTSSEDCSGTASVEVIEATGCPADDCSELFLSEYIEGSGNNKCIEIYNPTGSDVDLGAGDYELNIDFGSSVSVGTIDLTGTIVSGDVYVVCNSGATSTFTDEADLTTGSLGFNGDDAIYLTKAGTNVDVFGQIGNDDGNFAQNVTYRRKSTIQTGDPDGSDAFDASIEWDNFPQDNADDLGSHTSDCVDCTPYTITITGDLEYCSNDGSTTLDAGAGFTTYAWSNNESSQQITATAGTYFVTVTNASGCTGTGSTEVSENTSPNPSITGDLEYCSNEANVTLDAGAGFTTYAWSNNESSQQITATAGIYTVTVTDDNGCTGTDSVEVTENANPTPDITGNLTYCTGSNTTLDAGAGFTTYSWSNNESTQQITVTVGIYTVTVTDDNGCTGTDSVEVIENSNLTPTITGDLDYCADGGSTTLDAGAGYTTYAWSNNESSQQITATAGIYTVTVTDASGCTGTDSVEVTENPHPTPDITGDLEYCSNEANVTLDAGAGFTTYAWSNNESSQQITATAGIYTVTVTDGNGCTGTDSVEVTENANPTPAITGNLTYCTGGNTTLDAGAGFTTYAWSNNESSQQITATAGIYTVTVTDGNGCTGTDSVEVTENANPTPAITGNLTYCTGGNTTLDAGAGFTTYAWSNNESSQQITVTAGIYTVTVTDGNGCTGTDSVEVIENSNLTPTITGDLEYCSNDGSTTLDARVGYTTYAWSNNESSQQITATAGTYFVTVTNASGCTGTGSAEVSENTSPNPSITGDLEYCESDETTALDAGEYDEYMWSTGENSRIISVKEGTYTVTVVDGNGCTGTDNVEVVQYNNPTPTISGDLEYCANDGNTSLDAGEHDQYMWSTDESTQQITATAGIYTVTVTDDNGCTGTDSVEVTENPNPEPNIDGDLEICPSESTVLDVGVFAYEVTYLWSNNGETTQTISVNNTGTYFVTVTSSDDCSGTASVEVIEGSDCFNCESIEVEITGEQIICSDEGVVLDAGTYEPLPNTYQWSNNAATQTIAATTSGIYTVTVTDNNDCSGTATIEVEDVCNAFVSGVSHDGSTLCAGEEVSATVESVQTLDGYDLLYLLFEVDNLGATTFVESNDSGEFTPSSGSYQICAYVELRECAPSPTPFVDTVNDMSEIGTLQDGCYDYVCTELTVPEVLSTFVGTGQAAEDNAAGQNVFIAEICGGEQPYEVDFTSSPANAFAIVEGPFPSSQAGCLKYRVTYVDEAEWTLTITDSNECTNGDVTFTSDGLPESPLPQIDNITSTNETCSGTTFNGDGTITVTVSGGDNSCDDYTYSATSTNGFSETGTFPAPEDDSTSELLLEDLSKGNYSITITDCAGTTTVGSRKVNRGGRGRRGCRGTSKGVETTDLLDSFNVFPNPFTRQTTMEFVVSEDVHISAHIYSIEGRLVKEAFAGTVASNTLYQVPIDASELAVGVYILQFTLENGTVYYEKLYIRK